MKSSVINTRILSPW